MNQELERSAFCEHEEEEGRKVFVFSAGDEW
jgi:hypothetical protein